MAVKHPPTRPRDRRHPKPSPRIRPSVPGDAQKVGPRLRVDDRRELRAMGWVDPVEALSLALEISSQSWTIEADGKPFCCFGIKSTDALGELWLLSTPEIYENRRWFIRHSKEWLGKVSRGHGYVGNLVDPRNTLHTRWLAWLGFDFNRERVHLGGYPFQLVAKCAE